MKSNKKIQINIITVININCEKTTVKIEMDNKTLIGLIIALVITLCQ